MKNSQLLSQAAAVHSHRYRIDVVSKPGPFPAAGTEIL